MAQQQGKVHQEMQLLEKEVEKRDSDIQQLQKQLKEAEHILVGAAVRWSGAQGLLDRKRLDQMCSGCYRKNIKNNDYELSRIYKCVCLSGSQSPY